MFTENIINSPDKMRNNILKLRKQNLPILFFGAGIGAKKLLHILKSYDVIVDHVVVDSLYYKQGQLLCGYPVESFNDVLKKYSKVIIVVSFNDNSNKIRELFNNQFVSECIVLDNGCALFDFPDFYNYVHMHLHEFETVYQLLEDDLSRKIMVAFINSKISKDAEELNYFNLNETIYHPDIISFHNNEVFVDCGAYNGDTIISFINNRAGIYSKIFAFEPDKNNYNILKKNVSKFINIEIFEKGAFSRKDKLLLASGEKQSSFISTNGDMSIEVDKIDNLVLGKVSYIKMDIEGAELEALKGAQKVIFLNTPKMAISVYHQPEDITTIPLFISSISQNSYKLYLRHYGTTTCDLVLYAIPKC